MLENLHDLLVTVREVVVILAAVAGALGASQWRQNHAVQKANEVLAYAEQLADWAVQATAQWAKQQPTKPSGTERKLRAVKLMAEQAQADGMTKTLPQPLLEEALEAAVKRLPPTAALGEVLKAGMASPPSAP